MRPEIKLTPAQLREYKEVGAICLRDVFSSSWVEKVIAGIDKNLESPSVYAERLPSDSGGAYFNDYCNWQSIPEFKEYIYKSGAAAIAAQLMESTTAIFYHEHVLVKEPGSSCPTPWHMDHAYYPIEGNQACSIWMPVDEIGAESTVRFVAGSHRWPGIWIPRKFATLQNYALTESLDQGKYVDGLEDSVVERDYSIVGWDVRPGDCVVFHMKTLHGAPGNASKSTSRRILSTRWLGDDTVIARRPWELSPPTLGGLQYGDKAVSKEFPLIWTST